MRTSARNCSGVMSICKPVDDFGGAQGAIEPGDVAVEGLLGGLGQAEVAAAGHDEHFLGGAVDGVHAFAEDEGGAGGDDGEQEHDPAAADEDIGVVDEVHGAILPQPHGGSEKVCGAHTKLQAFSSHEQGGLKKGTEAQSKFLEFLLEFLL